MTQQTVERSQERAYVYGFYDDSCGEFLYVGQSLAPKERHKAHLRGHLAKPELLSASVRFIILRETDGLSVSRLEAQIINNLKFRGQCKLNRNFGSARIRSPRLITNPIECSNGMFFIGKTQAARYFGCCSMTISNALKIWSGEIYDRNMNRFTIWRQIKPTAQPACVS